MSVSGKNKNSTGMSVSERTREKTDSNREVREKKARGGRADISTDSFSLLHRFLYSDERSISMHSEVLVKQGVLIVVVVLL